MRILIISYFFPPYNTMGAVRVGKAAKYLSAYGNEVIVVSADNQSWKGPLPKTLPLEIPKNNIIYSGLPVFHHLASFIIRLFTGGESSNGHFGWFIFAYADVRHLLKKWKPDVIYASGLPFTSFWIAHLISTQYKIPWVAELRDLWADNPRYPEWRRMLEGLFERRILSSASGFITVSNPLARILRRKYKNPILVSYNGFDEYDHSETNITIQKDRHLQIVYTGTIYKDWQDPSLLFHALKKMESLADAIRVHFYGPGLEFIRELADHFGILFLVEVHKSVAHDESLRLQAQADVLLLLQWMDSRQKGIYTGKLFEYIGARRPILSIGPTDNEPAELIINRRFGVALNEPEAISAQLHRWIIQKQEGGIPSLPKESTLSFSWDAQIQKIKHFLQKTSSSIL